MKNIVPRLFFLAVLAFFLPWAPARAEETHDSIVVVFDGSGSMEEPIDGKYGSGPVKMPLAKGALKRVLGMVPEDTWIGILVFSGQFGGDDWVVPLGPRVPDMNARIDGIKPGGGTPIGSYIKQGADRLLTERERQYGVGSYRLIVVTDGQATPENEAALMERYAPMITSRGIRMDVIGLGMEETHALAAYATSYQPAQNADQLDKALKQVVNVEAFSGNTAVAEEDFALLASLPIDVARVWIEDVTVKANWPIGEGPPKPKVVEPENSAAAPQGSPTPASEQPQQQSGGCSAIGFGSIPALALLLVLPATLRRRRSAA